MYKKRDKNGKYIMSEQLTLGSMAFFCSGMEYNPDKKDLVKFVRNVFNNPDYNVKKLVSFGKELLKISKIRNDADFHEFMKYYMETCPAKYFEKIKELRESRHVTIKYKTGDVFRMELDRFHYGYGIITGQVKEILKLRIDY